MSVSFNGRTPAFQAGDGSSILLTDSICWLYANGKQTGCDPVDVGSIPSGQPKRSVILTVKNSTDNRKIEVRLFYRPPYTHLVQRIEYQATNLKMSVRFTWWVP